MSDKFEWGDPTGGMPWDRNSWKVEVNPTDGSPEIYEIGAVNGRGALSKATERFKRRNPNAASSGGRVNITRRPESGAGYKPKADVIPDESSPPGGKTDSSDSRRRREEERRRRR